MTLQADELDRLKREFLDEAQDSLTWIQTALDEIHAGGRASPETTRMIRRDVHSLKGMGTGFEFPTLSLIAHKLEDYLDSIDALGPAEARDIEQYLDHIYEIVSKGADSGSETADELLSTLPGNVRTITPEQSVVGDVLVVVQSRVMEKVVERALAAQGYRVTHAETPWRAFELAVLLRPELIISSAVMDRVSGVDLLCALSQVEATAQIPMILLSSFEPQHAELKRLPPNAEHVGFSNIADGGLVEIVRRAVAEGSVPLPAVKGDHRSLRILMADDKKAIRLLVQVILQKQGHAIVMVESGVEAVQAVNNGNFDLILMDIEMPRMNGVEATRAIRGFSGPKGATPIIALTANDHVEDRVSYGRAGMNDYVSKPVEAAQLLEAIRRQTGVSPCFVEPVTETAKTASASPAPDKQAALEDLVNFLDE